MTMFDDILGERENRIINTGSTGDTAPHSFKEIWDAKQREINGDDDEDDAFEEYEGLQV
jgi:hypothetical protein